MSLLHRRVRAMLLAAGAFALPFSTRAVRMHGDLPAVEPNDNRTPAGRTVDGVRTVILEARDGVWEPDGPRGVRLRVAAFGEPGEPLQSPGPLIRVTSGTAVRAIVRNTLRVPLYVYGLGEQRGTNRDSVAIAPGAEREMRFRATEAGTYYYMARTVMDRGGPPRSDDDSQLHGAIVVDAPDARTDDRIFVISEWFTLDSTTMSGLGPHAVLAINGRQWPHTERLDAMQGDTLHWRVVNATILEHPLHLHGFYFRVDGRGDGIRDTSYTEAQRRSVVTEVVLPGTTMSMSWSPVRSGNWIFHCHFASHITDPARFEMDRRMPARPLSSRDGGLVRTASLSREPMVAGESHASHDAMKGHAMSGLVMGIRVRPRGPATDYGPVRRRIQLEVRSKAKVYGEYVGYSYVLGGSAEAHDTMAMPVPGPTLVLTKGERVAITVVNRSHEPAAVHWHGIELESFPDGVPGWSGAGKHTLPLIAPGDSLTVRFTPPRAGTFMYHSHANEMQQISSGLYGTIVVVDPAVPRDTSRERTLLFSDDGPTVNLVRGPFPGSLLNGQRTPAPLELQAGVTYRLRLINIRGDGFTELALLDGETPVRWRTVAVDGADVPASAREESAATLLFAPGMIRDVEFTPRAPGRLTLRYENGRLPPPERKTMTLPVIVK